MRFLVDDQLPVALARALTAAGHDARHVFDCGLKGADDRIIWRYACEQARVIVTKDEDFVRLQSARPPRAPVLWLRVGNTRKQPFLAALMPVVADIVAKFDSGEMVVEVR